MKLIYLAVLFTIMSSSAIAQNGDRVYTADQTSNTVSVIDPQSEKLLGTIHLGEDVPAAVSPLYKGQLLVHGLGFSPDHKTLDVVSIGSNAVTLIDTQTNTVMSDEHLMRRSLHRTARNCGWQSEERIM